MTRITETDCSGYSAILFECNEQMHFQLVVKCKRDHYDHFSEFSRQKQLSYSYGDVRTSEYQWCFIRKIS